MNEGPVLRSASTVTNVGKVVASRKHIDYQTCGQSIEEHELARQLTVLMLAVLTACSSNSDSVTKLATRLANEGGVALSQEYRIGYITCGEKALSDVPAIQIHAALEAPDVPAMWEILGSDTLDAYVKACRETDVQRGPPPNS